MQQQPLVFVSVSCVSGSVNYHRVSVTGQTTVLLIYICCQSTHLWVGRSLWKNQHFSVWNLWNG